MKRFFLYSFVFLLFAVTALQPAHLYAVTGGTAPGQPVGGGECPPGRLCNPIASESFADIMVRVARIVVLIGLPLVVIMIIYAGSLYVFAQGSEERIKTAHKAFFWAVIGALLIVGAEAISLAIQNFARQL